MKRVIAALLGAIAVGAVPATAAAYLLSDELLAFIATVPATDDLAAGEGKFAKGQPAQQFTVAAHGNVFEATGNVRLNIEGFAETRGRVDCLFVFENRAGVAGMLEQPVGPAGAFRFFVLALEDNGEPSDDLVPDRAVVDVTPAHTSDADCGLAAALSTGGALIVQGNVVVKDR